MYQPWLYIPPDTQQVIWRHKMNTNKLKAGVVVFHDLQPRHGMGEFSKK